MFTAEQAQVLVPVFVGMLEHETTITRRVLAALPETQLDFKLGEKGRTARELMWHIIESEVWFGEAVCRGDFDQPPEAIEVPASVAAMVAWYDKRVPPLLEKIKALPVESMVKTANFFGAFNMPMVFYLSFWNTHTIHHRGQLSTYVRAVNGHVPDIYGGSADEPFQMPAPA
jgi:uncharacterized damage-inducible protein DinB